MMLSELVSAIATMIHTVAVNPGLLFVFAPFTLLILLASWLFRVLVLKRGMVVLAVAGFIGIVLVQELWNNDARNTALLLCLLLLFIARAGYLRLIEKTFGEEE